MGAVSNALWFATRPPFWQHAVELARRKFRPRRGTSDEQKQAAAWAETRAQPVAEALASLGVTADGALPTVPEDLLAEAAKRVADVSVEMGGAGDLTLIHAAVALSGATRVVETGVAFGWSSLAVLSALEARDGARLVSVDMPYPGRGNEPHVGVAVPDRLRGPWTLLRLPDRPGIPRAIEDLGGQVDLVHYDSDKSWYGRMYALPHVWRALKPGGLLLMDDIQDNMAFAEFVEAEGLTVAVTSAGGKYVGITRKPDSPTL